MNSLYLVILAIYLGLVGVNRNGQAFLTETQNDIGGFIPWFFSVLALSFVAQVNALEKPVKMFFLLAVLTMILKNNGAIQTQIKDLYNSLQTTTPTTTSTTTN